MIELDSPGRHSFPSRTVYPRNIPNPNHTGLFFRRASCRSHNGVPLVLLYGCKTLRSRIRKAFWTSFIRYTSIVVAPYRPTRGTNLVFRSKPIITRFNPPHQSRGGCILRRLHKSVPQLCRTIGSLSTSALSSEHSDIISDGLHEHKESSTWRVRR